MNLDENVNLDEDGYPEGECEGRLIIFACPPEHVAEVVDNLVAFDFCPVDGRPGPAETKDIAYGVLYANREQTGAGADEVNGNLWEMGVAHAYTVLAPTGYRDGSTTFCASNGRERWNKFCSTALLTKGWFAEWKRIARADFELEVGLSCEVVQALLVADL